MTVSSLSSFSVHTSPFLVMILGSLISFLIKLLQEAFVIIVLCEYINTYVNTYICTINTFILLIHVVQITGLSEKSPS